MGPSRRCKAIKSGSNSYFRFECGEFLRSSEVLTIFGHDDKELSKINQSHCMELGSHRQYSEGFAKLYRKFHEPIIERENDLDATPLASLVLPGEWVHVHCNEEVFLEECSHPPVIERHHQGGWWYITTVEGGIEIRMGPSFNAEVTANMLYAGEKAIVNERVKPSGDIITWLRLKDGQGWVYNVG